MTEQPIETTGKPTPEVSLEKIPDWMKKATAKIIKESTRITDLAMLGDCEKACSLLAELEAMKI